jgi:hypothetical protein
MARLGAGASAAGRLLAQSREGRSFLRMTNSADRADTRPSDVPPPPPQPPRRRYRKWLWLALAMLVVAPTIFFAVWTAVSMNYTYSEGQRPGYVQKFSKRGWLCKTWEGELAMVNIPGAMQEKWEFTVRSDSVAAEIEKLAGKQVVLHYEQHKKVPFSCLGDTEYFVTGVRLVAP